MDFLGSYIPPSPTQFTPRSDGVKFEDMPDSGSPCDEKQMQMIRNGNYEEVRKIRKDVEKKTGQVRFIAPLSEDGASLQSITLTPKVEKVPLKLQRRLSTESKSSQPATSKRPRSEQQRVKEKMNLFGFKFRKSSSLH